MDGRLSAVCCRFSFHPANRLLVFLLWLNACFVVPTVSVTADTTSTQAADPNHSNTTSQDTSTAVDVTSRIVLVAQLDDAIGPASGHFLLEAIETAENKRASCLVIELDTPGGLDESMRDIVKAILAADVPVVVYVSPSGARAASAGLFILLAGHVAAMAPGTNTGSAHPVNLGGGEVDENMMEKIENDAASFMRSLAQKRGRNVEWAESAVRESKSVSADEALEKGVIDFVEPSLDTLLERIDGRTIEILSGSRTVQTKNATIERIEMGWRDRALSLIANPNVAYLLLMLGTMGLMMELWNPGAVLPGVVGAISLLLAFFALQVMPVSSVGLLLMVLGVVLLVLEIKVTSYGLLTIGGVVSLALGAVFLFESAESFYRVSWSVIIPTVVVTTLFFLFVVGKGLLAQKTRPTTGREGMIGEIGFADSRIAPQGRVFVHGEYWDARSEESLEEGAEIEVVAVEGRMLVVRPRSL